MCFYVFYFSVSFSVMDILSGFGKYKAMLAPSLQGREELEFHVFVTVGVASPFPPESALWVDCCNMLVGYPNYSPCIVRFVTCKTTFHSCCEM